MGPLRRTKRKRWNISKISSLKLMVERGPPSWTGFSTVSNICNVLTCHCYFTVLYISVSIGSYLQQSIHFNCLLKPLVCHFSLTCTSCHLICLFLVCNCFQLYGEIYRNGKLMSQLS